MQLSQHLPQAEVLVIDDASPDGTGNWCESVKDKFPHLRVVHRSGKLGLGSAAQVGFRWALERDYTLIATMDADLSHDPASLNEMVKLITDNPETDVVIGSRYVAGGGTEGWPFHRKLASRVVNLWARTILRLSTRDNSGAFRVYRRRALESIDLDRLKSNDYAYLEEVLWRMRQQDLRFKEHPIVFRNRESGSSKTNAFLGVSVFWQILKMGLGLWR